MRPGLAVDVVNERLQERVGEKRAGQTIGRIQQGQDATTSSDA
jgi:hypothetical protein